jgi:hypothetical protein
VDWTWHRHQAGAGLWGSAPPSPSEIRKNIFDNYNVIRVNATRRATPTAPPTGSHRSSALLPLASAARAGMRVAPPIFSMPQVGLALRANLAAFKGRGVASPRPPHQECKAKPCPTLSSPNGELLGWHAVPTLPRGIRAQASLCLPSTQHSVLCLPNHQPLSTIR